MALEKFWADDAFQTQIAEKAKVLNSRLVEIAGLVPGATLKGRGMMQGIDVGSGDLAGAICATCFDHGLIIETSGAHDEVVKVLAPLTIPVEQLKAGLDILEDATRANTQTHKIAAE